MTTIEQARAVEQRLRKCAVTEISPWDAADTIASLITGLEVAQRDAARYRWLRDKGDDTWVPLKTRWLDSLYTDQAEAHIDAAIAAGGAK